MSVERLDQSTADILISKIAGGDMKALESLYNAMYREIYGYLYVMMSGDRQTAEDLTQDTFIRVYKYAPGFAARGQGRSWVYRIAGRLALNALGSKRLATEELSESLHDSSDVENSAISSHMLREAIDSLSVQERQVVLLHAVSGLSLREISGMLGQPLGTVKWRHSEALKKLRSKLKE